MQKCRVEYAKSAEKIPPSPPLFDIANRKGLGRIKIDVRAEGDKKTRFQKNTFRLLACHNRLPTPKKREIPLAIESPLFLKAAAFFKCLRQYRFKRDKTAALFAAR